MFSNMQQQNSSNLIHQAITSNSVVLPPPPPAISISSIVLNCNNVAPGTTTMLALDGLNCGGIPTRTTPTLTPTTLRTIEADLASLTPAQSEDFAAAAASDLHHLVSPSCSSINVSSAGAADRLSSELQDRHNLQNLGNQHLSLQNLNNQQINLTNLQSHQHINQHQQNDYNNSFSVASSRQAGFVPPLVLQISNSNASAQQPSVLMNSNNGIGSSSVFNAKGSSTSASSSHWQGAVVTQTTQHQTRSVTKQHYTDDEDGDEDFDSGADDGTDSSDTTSGKTTRKQSTKNNKNNSKNNSKSEFKSTTNSTGGGRRSNKDNKVMSAEEEQRRQIRRERNKMAAARCRKRRMDHTNELLEETEQLEDKRLRLQVEIQTLRQKKNSLQQLLEHHKCAINSNNRGVTNTVSTISHVTSLLDSNVITESNTIVLSNDLSSTVKMNSLQPNVCTNIINHTDGNTILIKRENNDNLDNKDNMDIPTSVMQQSHRERPTTLLSLNTGNFANKKNDSNGVVVLNFDSLMDGGTGLTPVSSGSVQNHQQQAQPSGPGNNSILS